MREFSISTVEDGNLEKRIKERTEQRNRLYGSLGLLEDVALQVALIQQREEPRIKKPAILVFAGDHGIASELPGASSGQDTYQMVLHFLNGGAAVNFFCKQNNIHLKVIDAGVDHHFEGTLTYWLHHGTRLINRKIDYGTKSFTLFPAMTSAQCEKALKTGEDLVKKEKKHGCNMIGLGEVGCGNTASALAVASSVLDVTVEEIAGPASATNSEMLAFIGKAIKKHPKTHDPQTILTLFGGFEMAAMVGACLKAAEEKIIVLIDSLVSSCALLLASRINTNVTGYCLFSQVSDVPGHRYILDHFKARPVLQLGITMGEGVGTAMAIPLIQNSVHLLNEMGFERGEE